MSEINTSPALEQENQPGSQVELVNEDPNKRYEFTNRTYYQGQGPDGWVNESTSLYTDGDNSVTIKQISNDETKKSYDVSNANFVVLREYSTISYEALGADTLTDKITIIAKAESLDDAVVSEAVSDLRGRANVLNEVADRIKTHNS